MDQEKVKEHIDRYFKAVHGPTYVYRAPETFQNAVEQWMLAVAADSEEMAEHTIATIEDHFKAARQ